jgi:hypothetical protein
MVCLRYISVDTLHKGDTEDDDDNNDDAAAAAADDDNNNNNNNNNNNDHIDNTRAVRREAKLALLNHRKINFILALLK